MLCCMLASLFTLDYCLKVLYRSPGVSKNPFAVVRAVFVLSLFHVPK